MHAHVKLANTLIFQTIVNTFSEIYPNEYKAKFGMIFDMTSTLKHGSINSRI